MTLEFEKLTDDLDQMARNALKWQRERHERANSILQTLYDFADDWDAIDRALTIAGQKADEKFYRSARPLDGGAPLNAQIEPPDCPPQATVIATDGSQIMPDRHAAFLYYLVNVGGIIYSVGNGRSPQPFTTPDLQYLQEDQIEEDFLISGGQVSIQRDLAEIGTLARTIWERRHEAAPPTLGLVDQRLLYWPIGSTGAAAQDTVRKWCARMTEIRRCGALLAGYIDRPGKIAVATLLQSLNALSEPDFDWRSLGKRGSTQGVNDAYLFGQLLQPGQRSCLFIDVSPSNEHFAELDRENQICFFYYKPGAARDIARVDVPLWVAADTEAVAVVHGLIHAQCQILGDYPYALARADEEAVVSRQDKENLDTWIDNKMQEYGVAGNVTAKLSSKGLARGSRTRHEGV